MKNNFSIWLYQITIKHGSNKTQHKKQSNNIVFFNKIITLLKKQYSISLILLEKINNILTKSKGGVNCAIY